ncbi:hypothetical protein FA13DRAFT_1640629 [Coprinellus micaceus]|uniref:Uncharacterized protein n=1 Tax=Coprinellus micaceus TaxID=71717 RepID=A0A4Y7SMC1_COPMI|nr:hypothetical protein FA13DRAFT_1640629 [Coprinellus micaceus]
MDNEPRPAPPTPPPPAPPPAPPRLHYAEDILPQPLRRVILHIRDKLVTEKNIFGLWREYLHRPHFDPDSFVPPESLAKDAHAHDDLFEPPTPKLNLLSKNKSWGILLSWASTGSQMKSEQEINRLANLLQDVDFNPKELKGLTAQRAAKEMEKEDANSSLLSKFKEAVVSIEVPSGSTAIPSRTVNIPGLYYRPLCSLIRSAFAHPLAAQYHFTPYRLHHTSSQTRKTQRVFSELYDSDVFIEEHDQVQRARNPPDDPHCKREKVIAAMMLWSDSTHLANFGTAKLWPVYMALGNLSKYVRSLPNSGALHHVAYIPSLPDSFQDVKRCKYDPL